MEPILLSKLRSGRLTGFDNIIVYRPHAPKDEDQWHIMAMENIDPNSFPMNITADKRMSFVQRMTVINLRVGSADDDYGKVLECCVFARIETGCEDRVMLKEFVEGPLNFYNQRMDKGLSPWLSYCATVENFIEPIHLTHGFL